MQLQCIFHHIVQTTHASIRQYDRKTRQKTAEYGTRQAQKESKAERKMASKIEAKTQEKEDFADSQEQKSGLEEQLLAAATRKYPVLHMDAYPMAYGIIAGKKDIFLVGPMRMVYGVEVAYSEELLLLHNLLNDTDMTYLEFSEYNFGTDSLRHKVMKERQKVYFKYQEGEKVHNPYDRELRERESIRKGDARQLEQSLDEVFEGEYGTLSKDRLQSEKNLGMCGITIASRAAIEGGIHPEVSFSICDSYMMQVDEASHIGEVQALVRRAKFEYVEMVQQVHQSDTENMTIEQCKNLIFQRMHQKIEIRELAEKLYISQAYLSVLFKKKEGVTVGQYIAREKIKLAENLLMYSEYSYGDIAYYFGYCSQSHFGKVFKQVTGMTPRQFRERYQAGDFVKHSEK